MLVGLVPVRVVLLMELIIQLVWEFIGKHLLLDEVVVNDKIDPLPHII
jgi:hypothetical protein